MKKEKDRTNFKYRKIKVLAASALLAGSFVFQGVAGGEETYAAAESNPGIEASVSASGTGVSSPDAKGTSTKTNLTGSDVEDGSYPIEVQTASGPIRISDATLTAEQGKLTLHLTLKDGSKKDVEIEALDTEVLVENSEIVPLSSSLPGGALKKTASGAYQPLAYQDIPLMAGSWKVSVTLEGGSGRASVKSPCTLRVDEDGRATAVIEWSSNHYDYMIVGGKKYTPINHKDSESGSASGSTNGAAANSQFKIPVAALDQPETVIADTTAMSRPYEIEYKLTFSSKSAVKEKAPARKSTAAERIGGVAAVLVIAFLGALLLKKLLQHKLL